MINLIYNWISEGNLNVGESICLVKGRLQVLRHISTNMGRIIIFSQEILRNFFLLKREGTCLLEVRLIVFDESDVMHYYLILIMVEFVAELS